MPNHAHQNSALFANASTAAARRLAQTVTVALVLVAAAILPSAQIQLPNLPFFLPGVLTTTVMIDLFIAYLLYGQFIVSGSPAILVLAAAFVVRGILLCGYSVASPGVILGAGYLPFGPQAAPWMLVLWHLSFPVLVAAYAWIERHPIRSLPANRVVPVLGLCLIAALGLGAGVFAAVFAARDALPPIIEGTSYRSVITSGIAPLTMIVDAAVVLLVVAALRGRSVVQLWLTVAMVAALLDTVLISAGGARHTVGWYASHLMALGGSAILLAALLHEMTLLYASLAAAKADLAIKAETDELTGLGNRRQFDAMLEREWQRATRDGTAIALLMIDIDRFKAYNDGFGHPAGDACLRRIAQAIRHALHRPADQAARYGGEEFAAVLPKTDLAGARHIAEVIRTAVRTLAIAHPAGGTVSVSIGVAMHRPQIAETPDWLIDLADAALYRAKNEGRDRVVADGDPAPDRAAA